MIWPPVVMQRFRPGLHSYYHEMMVIWRWARKGNASCYKLDQIMNDRMNRGRKMPLGLGKYGLRGDSFILCCDFNPFVEWMDLMNYMHGAGYIHITIDDYVCPIIARIKPYEPPPIH